MTPQEFVAKWSKVSLSERSACQQHFLDLCELVNKAFTFQEVRVFPDD